VNEALLHALKRNKYYYGKLLDVSHMQLEQCYTMEKRQLLNRLALGPGVLCGHHVSTAKDGTLSISPGVTLDYLGREIVVPVTISGIDPTQATDANGCLSNGKPIEDKSTIYLCYTECDTEPAPVYVSECDGVASKAHSATEERYRVVVRPGFPDDEPPALTPEQRDAIFPESPSKDFDRRVAAEQTLGGQCPAPPDMTCVVLATVTLPSGEDSMFVDQYTYRPEVFSNTVLFELIAALADRVDICCAAIHYQLSIEVTDNQNQPGKVSQPLEKAVELTVTGAAGRPSEDADVKLSTTDGELSVDNVAFATEVPTTSGPGGKINVWWRLGPNEGQQTFTATLASGASTRGIATAAAAEPPPEPPPEPPAQPDAPRVDRISPPDGEPHVDRDFIGHPEIIVDFDQEMRSEHLARPGFWLRAWWFVLGEDGRLGTAHRIKLFTDEGGNRRTATYLAEALDGGPAEGQSIAVLVIIRGSGQIVAAASQRKLDADFQGARLAPEQLDMLWNADDQFQPDGDFSDRALKKPEPFDDLPSGNGDEGGEFHSFFIVPRDQ
jgi:hypothetical protein